MKIFKRIISIILVITVLITTGVGFSACSKSDKAEGKMMVSDYLIKVIDEFNMNQDSEETTEDNVLEIAKKWELVDNEDISLTKSVTEGFVLVTLVKTVGFYDVSSLDKYQIAEYAVENNYNGFKYKDEKDFNKCPSKAEVIASINKAKDIYLNPNFEEVNEVDYQDDVADLTGYSVDESETSQLALVNTSGDSSSADSETDSVSGSSSNSTDSSDESDDFSASDYKRKQVVLNGKADIKEGQSYVSPTLGANSTQEMYVAEKVEYSDGKTYITNSTENLELDSIMKEYNVRKSGTATNLNEMTIIDGNGNLHYPEESSESVESVDNTLQNVSPTYMSYNPNEGYNMKKVAKAETEFSIDFGDLSVAVAVKKKSFECKVSGTIYSKENVDETLDFNSESSSGSKVGVKVEKAFEVKDINFDYDYSLLGRSAYLNISTTTVDKMGLEVTNDREKKTQVEPEKINKAFSESKFVKSKKLFTLPIYAVGPLSIDLIVKLKLSISGGVEIVVTTARKYGITIDKHGVRSVEKENQDKDLNFHAKVEATAYIGPALCVGGTNIISFGAEFGLGAEYKLTLHVVDKETNLQLYHENFGVDLSENLSVSDSLKCEACHDINVYFILKLTVDTDSFLARALKISWSKEVFGKDNASIKALSGHFEDGKKVKECTREYDGKEKTTEEETEVSSDSIELSAFSMTINEGDKNKIQVEAVPSGYKSSELIYESDDTDVVTVSANGTVNGKKSGTARVSVYTKDKKYKAAISVTVMKKLSVLSYEDMYEVKRV